ncbi:hypothetical protein PF008_g24064 [Phytophthora fragariae]|uniref:Uncharacterized protein n=1 Tax=Phytophthora fragariae TaxID=53985 RepID=A0A6G0QNW8_9STRA|nr:hypothetical protein PF008_g24064 [Phytophthora fragariae]
MKCAAVSAAVTVSLTGMRCTIFVNRSTKNKTPVRPSASGGSPKMKSMETSVAIGNGRRGACGDFDGFTR